MPSHCLDKKRRFAWTLASCGLAGGMLCPPSAAQPATRPAAAEVTRPGYTVRRYNEDWSSLANVERHRTDDLWDPIKYVSLGEDTGSYASFGGQYRLCVEAWDNFGFSNANDDTFVLNRFQLHSDVHLNDRLRVFVQGKTAVSTDRDLPGGKRALDVDSLALQQAFVDVELSLGDNATLTLRPGRQELLFGKQRLVSPLPWANTRRTWDGVSAILETGEWKTTGFWSQFAPVQKYDFNDPDRQTQFFGIYASGPLTEKGEVNADVYYLGLDRQDAQTFNGTSGEEQRDTFGARLFGDIGDTGLDYDIEAAYQAGEVGADDVSAFMVGSELGYSFDEASGAPRAFVGFDYGSGDDSPGGDVETFNQLFPLGHAYLGYIDAIGRQNIIDLTPGLTVKPMPELTLKAQSHFFWRASQNDGVYNAGGGVLRGPGGSDDRFVGSEIDLLGKYQLNRNASVVLGYSRFFPGGFIDDTGPSDDINFVYTMFNYKF